MSVDGEEALSPLIADGFRASYKRLDMVALDPLVTRWQEARCRSSTSVGRRARYSTERPLTSAGGVPVDIKQPSEQRVDDEQLVFSIVGSE